MVQVFFVKKKDAAGKICFLRQLFSFVWKSPRRLSPERRQHRYGRYDIRKAAQQSRRSSACFLWRGREKMLVWLPPMRDITNFCLCGGVCCVPESCRKRFPSAQNRVFHTADRAFEQEAVRRIFRRTLLQQAGKLSNFFRQKGNLCGNIQ